MNDNIPTYEERKQALDHLIKIGLVEYKQVAGLEAVEITPLGRIILGIESGIIQLMPARYYNKSLEGKIQ